jgi:hypothetical protein
VCVSKKGRSRLALPRTTRSPMQCLLTRLDRNVHAPWLDELGPVVLHLLLGLADLRIYTVDKYIPCVPSGQTTSSCRRLLTKLQNKCAKVGWIGQHDFVWATQVELSLHSLLTHPHLDSLSP